eukprot:m.175871 g.175871  ORF g.175871 m.175871 type:complete len:424 (+) comp15336_c0_seq6:86-1357(+)
MAERGRKQRGGGQKHASAPATPASHQIPIILAKQPSTERPREHVAPRELFDPSSGSRKQAPASAAPPRGPPVPMQLAPQRGVSAPTPTIAARREEPQEPQEPQFSAEVVKLLDNRLVFQDTAKTLLSETQSNFLVVGVLGCQGVGKSRVLAALHSSHPHIFAQQGRDTIATAAHQTSGIDLTVSPERVILLDSQPLLSISVLDWRIRTDAPLPASTPTHEAAAEIQSIQLAMFLFAVCHAVVVVQDSPDPALARLLASLEQLHPSPTEFSFLPRSESLFQADRVFVFNRAAPELFSSPGRDALLSITSSLLDRSPRPGRSEGSPCVVLIPHASDAVETTSKHGRGPHVNHNQVLASHGSGHLSYASCILDLRQKVLATPRRLLHGLALTERKWLQFAAEVWVSLQRAASLREYAGFLSDGAAA